MRATFQYKKQLSTDIWEFFLLPESPVDYQPGQYLSVTIPSTDGMHSDSRTFSLTSFPDEPMISFAAKVPSPCSDYKQRLSQLTEGAPLAVSQAMGDLVLPRDTSRPLIFVAGGLGIASFVGMMRWLAEHDQPRTIHLLYAAHSSENLLFGKIISSCPGIIVEYVISPSRVTAERILHVASPAGLIYLSGSEPFVMDIRSQLLTAGKSPTDIVFDFFDGYKPNDF